MREIARQVVEQTGSDKFSALPPEDDENPFSDDTQEAQVAQTLPPSSHLPSLIASLSSLSRPVIVLLDGFHLFTGHARQALLYCLLDTVQSCRSGAGYHKGLAVVGLTSRVDVVNLLEKRVKSRFSHRLLRTAGVGSIDGWISILRRCLSVHPVDSEVQPATSSSSQLWAAYWEYNTNQFLADRNVVQCLKDLFGLTRDFRTLQKAMVRVRLFTELFYIHWVCCSLASSHRYHLVRHSFFRRALRFIFRLSENTLCLLRYLVSTTCCNPPDCAYLNFPSIRTELSFDFAHPCR